MDTSQEIYKELEQQVKRLSDNGKLLTIEEVLKGYILPEVTEEQRRIATEILTRKRPENLQKIFDEINAIREAIKILALMQASNNVEEFKNLANKKRERTKNVEVKEPNDFDEFVKGILSVPKPSKEELKDYLKKNSKK